MPDDGKKPSAAVAVTATSRYPIKIVTAIYEVMGKVGYVQKKGTNEFQKYKYAGEEHLLEALRPAMHECGLLLVPSGRSRSPIDEHGITHVEIEYTLLHKDGDVWPEKLVAYGDGGDKNSKGVGDKGLYKALTGANKYLLFKLFQIATGNDPEKDGDEDEGDSTPPNATQVERKLTKDQARPEYNKLVKEIQACQDPAALAQWGQTNKPRLDAMPEDWQVSLRNEYSDHKANLMGRAAQ